jgi:hypothetical protein
VLRNIGAVVSAKLQPNFLVRGVANRHFLIAGTFSVTNLVHRIVDPSVIHGRACVDARINTQGTTPPSAITFHDHKRYEKHFDGTCHNI